MDAHFSKKKKRKKEDVIKSRTSNLFNTIRIPVKYFYASLGEGNLWIREIIQREKTRHALYPTRGWTLIYIFDRVKNNWTWKIWPDLFETETNNKNKKDVHVYFNYTGRSINYEYMNASHASGPPSCWSMRESFPGYSYNYFPSWGGTASVRRLSMQRIKGIAFRMARV